MAIKRRITWKTGLFMASGVLVLIIASVGPLAQQVGPVSIAVWGLAAALGIFNVLIYSELASMYPDAVGGMTMCMGDAYDQYSKWPNIITKWSYWYGWAPVLGIMPMLCAEYLNQVFGTSWNPYVVATIILLFLYAVNYFGIEAGTVSQAIILVMTIVPMIFVLIVPFFKGLIDMGNLVPFRPYGDWGNFSNPEGSWTSGVSWLGIGAAFYVATWSAYAFETISVYVGEYKDPHKDTVRAAWTSGLAVTVFYVFVPLALIGVLGVKGFSENPDYPFLVLAEATLGVWGGKAAMLMLCGAFLLMANTAFNGTARIMYGMSQEGLHLKQFGRLNKHGFPWVAAIFNIVMGVFLMTFGAPVRIIAASNLAYMICIFMPLFAFVILRRKRPHHKRLFRLPDVFVPIALILGIFNVVLIVPGALLYGTEVMLTGSVITLAIVPFCLYRWYVQDKRALQTAGPEVGVEVE